MYYVIFFCIKQKTAYEMRISDWSSDVFSSYLDCTLHLPAQIGDYTDFYPGIRHAENVGRLFRPDDPLLPNYKYVPIGYHGRASSVQVSGAALKIGRASCRERVCQDV